MESCVGGILIGAAAVGGGASCFSFLKKREKAEKKNIDATHETGATKVTTQVKQEPK